MKPVLISIQRPHTDNIKALLKKIEVRKGKPNQETPFPCYIYETKAKGGCGKVIGEFVCDKIEEYKYEYCPHPEIGMNFDCCDNWWDIDDEDLEKSCLSYEEFKKYADKSVNVNDIIYGWHISDLKIYDKPKELEEFKRYYECGNNSCGTCDKCDKDYHLKKPPQSWCYVDGCTRK